MRTLLGPLLNRIRRNKTLRLLEGRIRFDGKRRVGVGETKKTFLRPGWETVDLVDADYLCDLRRDPLPFPDESVDVMTAAHVVEHLDYPNASSHFFTEAYRALRRGGLLRISMPDADLLIRKYKEGDWWYFLSLEGLWRLRLIIRKQLPPEAILIHNLFFEWFASFSGRLDTAGGPILPKVVIDEKVNSLDAFEFSRWAVAQLPPNRVYAHVNVYTYERLEKELKAAGFGRVVRCEFDESSDPLCKRHHIDREYERRASLYAEAFKE